MCSYYDTQFDKENKNGYGITQMMAAAMCELLYTSNIVRFNLGAFLRNCLMRFLLTWVQISSAFEYSRIRNMNIEILCMTRVLFKNEMYVA